MASLTQNPPPPGINFLDRWGPTLFPGGKLYIFKGEKHVVPTTWKNAEKMMKTLKYIEQFEWKLALPEQRQELFNRQLEVLTKDLPVNWELVGCAVASGAIIIFGVISTVKSAIAKL